MLSVVDVKYFLKNFLSEYENSNECDIENAPAKFRQRIFYISLIT